MFSYLSKLIIHICRFLFVVSHLKDFRSRDEEAERRRQRGYKDAGSVEVVESRHVARYLKDTRDVYEHTDFKH